MLKLLLLSLLCFLQSAGDAGGLPKPVPHLDQRGQAAYQDFLAAEPPRAFAIAPGGSYGWVSEAASEAAAEAQALAACRRHSEQTCVLFAVNRKSRFVPDVWPTLWAPYSDTASAAKAMIGLKRGMRFPDLMLHDPAGKALRLSENLRGQVLVLHFWGSWCPHCRLELPALQRLAGQIGKHRVRFLLLQMREDANTSRSWLKREKIDLPQYDSGERGPRDTVLTLAGGGSLEDRDIAGAFPSTYVLDRHGVVLFSHIGPIPDWSQYAAFLKHAARH